MQKLERVLSLSTTISIVIGGIIGSGIFMKPALIAGQLGSPLVMILVWVVAGFVTLFGALSNAEIAAMFPETGGQYVFFQKMYGEAFAFMYGWAAFSVFNTAGNASIAYVFSQYTNYFIHLPRFSQEIEHASTLHLPFVGTFFPLENFGVKLLTIFLVIMVSWLNYVSVQISGTFQRVLTALKSVSIVLLILGILFSGKGEVVNLFQNAPNAPTGWAMVAAFTAAISGAFWAYDGWNNISYIAGEVKEPQKNIPKSLFWGISFSILVYVLVNIAYLYVLPITNLAKSDFVASDAASVVYGAFGGILITLMVVLSTLGTANANIFATARATYTTGNNNTGLSWAGKTHPKFKTPGNALLLNALWSILLILSGSFDMLTDMLIFVSWFFYGMSGIGLFILRKKLKDTPRFYKVWGYPIVPLIFVIFTILFLGITLFDDVSNYLNGKTPIINAVFGILITVIGLPIYYFVSKK